MGSCCLAAEPRFCGHSVLHLKLLLTVSWRHTDSQTAALISCTKTTALNIDTDHGDLSLKSRWQTTQSPEVFQHVPLLFVLLVVSMHPTRAREPALPAPA